MRNDFDEGHGVDRVEGRSFASAYVLSIILFSLHYQELDSLKCSNCIHFLYYFINNV